MTPELEKLVVIGCSAGGKEAVEYLVPKLNLNSNAAVVVPHIENKEIYDSLCDLLGDNVIGIESDTVIKQGCVYVVDYTYPSTMFTNGRPIRENIKSLFKTIRFENASIQPVFPPFSLSFNLLRINYAMKSAAENYGTRCIGVVLSGAGNDGSAGVKHIKRRGGRVLVQIENYPGFIKSLAMTHNYGMPKNAQKATEVDFAGPLPELVTVLNKYLIR